MSEVNERTAHASTHIFGLALLAAATIAATVLALLFTEGEGTFVPTALIAIAVAGVVWRFDRTWAYVVGVIGTLAVTAGIFFLAFGIFQVFSPIEFILGLVLTLGFFISLVSGIRALVASIRDRTAPVSSGKRFRQTILGVVGALSVVSITGFFLTQSSVSNEQADQAVTVDMTKFEFEPHDITVNEGQMLLVTNSDPFAHDITLEEFDVYEHLTPGSEALVSLSSVPPGTYTYHCSLHTDPSTGEGMTGQITVES